mgnify:CR=1 FL=1
MAAAGAGHAAFHHAHVVLTAAGTDLPAGGVEVDDTGLRVGLQAHALAFEETDGDQVLFDHANIGGFKGAFTDANTMAILRRALLETARKTLGNDVSDVLITEIARQDA